MYGDSCINWTNGITEERGCFQPAFQVGPGLTKAQAGENLAPWNHTPEE